MLQPFAQAFIAGVYLDFTAQVGLQADQLLSLPGHFRAFSCHRQFHLPQLSHHFLFVLKQLSLSFVEFTFEPKNIVHIDGVHRALGSLG